MIYLALAVNLVTAALGAATLASYVFIYTPLKRITTLNTVIGAIPGALPPLIEFTRLPGKFRQRLVSLCNPLFLAIASFPRHRLDV